jgi:hypothetical protein
MTAQTPAYLKARFENGDVPVAADYEDVFDSYLNVATSSIQTLVGGVVSTNFIQASELNASLVSAASVNASFVSAQTVNASFISCGTMSAATVSARDLYVVSAYFLNSVDVSAVATTQAGTVAVNGVVNFIISAENNNNSVRLPPSSRGRVQTIINASTTAIKIFPAVSGRFLVTAVNASLTIQADRCATIYHQGNDRYGIQVG